MVCDLCKDIQRDVKDVIFTCTGCGDKWGQIETEKTAEYPCSQCGKKIIIHRHMSPARVDALKEREKKAAVSPLNDTAIRGAMNWFTIGYGSDFDLECWLLLFCDECLEKMKPLYSYNYLMQMLEE